MELKYKLIPLIVIMIALVLYVNAVEQKIYVDSDHNAMQIYNVSNLTITNKFTDGTLTILGGDITGADDINATEFYQAGALVVDTATIVNLTANYSVYANSSRFWDDINSISSVYFYVTSELLTFNESKVNLTIGLQVTAANDSMKSYSDTQDALANTSVKNWVGSQGYYFDGDNVSGFITSNVTAGNTSLRLWTIAQGYYFSGDNVSGFITSNVTAANDSMIEYTGATFWNRTGGISSSNITDTPSACPSGYYVTEYTGATTVCTYAYYHEGLSGENVTSGIVDKQYIDSEIARDTELIANETTRVDLVIGTYVPNNYTAAIGYFSGSDNISIDTGVISFNKTLDYISNETTRVDLVVGTYIPNNYTAAISYFSGSDNISIDAGVISLNKSCVEITGSAGLCDGTDADTPDTTIANETTRVDLIIGTYIPNNMTNVIKNATDAEVAKLNVTLNISQTTDYYHCFGPECNGSIYYNGSELIIKVN